MYLTSEKENSEKKGAKAANLPKMVHVADIDIISTHQDSIEIREFVLDTDASVNTSAEEAASVAHSLRSKLVACPSLVLYGVTTDSGGGDILDSYKSCLSEEGVAGDDKRVST